MSLTLKLDFIPSCFTNAEGEVRFRPQVYIQRYNAVHAILELPVFKGHFRKLADFGCAEMGFFFTVKNGLEDIEHLLEVDVDREKLIANSARVGPLLVDYIRRRSRPFVVEIYEGSVTEPSEVLLGTDVVVAIELIEHLEADVLVDVPANIFGFIEPKVAIFTTPNSEVNVMFPGLTGFRHWDHKFEWTRSEFATWADEICRRFPKYSVQYFGIAPGLPGTEHLGETSQMAVFLRSDMQNLVKGQPIVLETQKAPKNSPNVGNYKLVTRHEYPFEKDERTRDQKVEHELIYLINRFESSHNVDQEEEFLVPVEIICQQIQTLVPDPEELRTFLEFFGYTVINDKILVKHNYSSSSSDEADYYCQAEEQLASAMNCEATKPEEESWD